MAARPPPLLASSLGAPPAPLPLAAAPAALHLVLHLPRNPRLALAASPQHLPRSRHSRLAANPQRPHHSQRLGLAGPQRPRRSRRSPSAASPLLPHLSLPLALAANQHSVRDYLRMLPLIFACFACAPRCALPFVCKASACMLACLHHFLSPPCASHLLQARRSSPCSVHRSSRLSAPSSPPLRLGPSSLLPLAQWCPTTPLAAAWAVVAPSALAAPAAAPRASLGGVS